MYLDEIYTERSRHAKLIHFGRISAVCVLRRPVQLYLFFFVHYFSQMKIIIYFYFTYILGQTNSYLSISKPTGNKLYNSVCTAPSFVNKANQEGSQPTKRSLWTNFLNRMSPLLEFESEQFWMKWMAEQFGGYLRNCMGMRTKFSGFTLTDWRHHRFVCFIYIVRIVQMFWWIWILYW